MKRKRRKKSPCRAPKREATFCAQEIERILGMPHEEFVRAQKELVEKGFIEIIDGDIDSDRVVYKLNFLL